MLNFALFENVAQAKSFLRQHGIPDNDFLYQKIREIFKGHEGYVGWLTKVLYPHLLQGKIKSTNDINGDTKEHMADAIKTIRDEYIGKREIIQKLDKPVIQYKTYEDFSDAFIIAEKKLKAKKIYDEFPSEQKSFIDINDKSIYNLLSQLYDKDDKSDFIRKISAYHDKQSLISRMTMFINSSGNEEFDKQVDKLIDLGLDIKYTNEDNHIIIARMYNYRQCSILGGSTSWCIARSDSTFRSYAGGLYDKQYVIYLTDLPSTSNKSIIGATFNVGGYRTAHLKDDSYISDTQLKSLLLTRGYDMDNLKVKREEINKKDFDRLFVQQLLDAGFSKEDIIKNKSEYSGNDIKKFTKEEIYKHKNLMNLVDAASVENLLNIGFTKEELYKIKHKYNGSDYRKFSKDEIVKHNLIGIINATSVSTLHDIGFSMKEIYETKKEYTERDLQNMSKKEIYANNLIDAVKSFSMRTLMSRKMGFTKEEILKFKDTFDKNDLDYLEREDIINLGLYRTLGIRGRDLSKFSKEEIQQRNMIEYVINGTVSIDNLLEFDISFIKNVINNRFDLLNIEAKEFYDKYLKHQKEDYKSAYYYQVGSKWTNKRDEKRYNLNETLFRLKWYDIGPDDYSLDELTSAIEDMSHSYEMKNIFNFLKEQGYTYTEKEIKEFLRRSKSTYMDGYELYVYGIDNGVDYYPELIEMFRSSKSPYSKYKMEAIKKALEKHKDSEKLIEELNDVNNLNIFIKDATDFVRYWSHSEDRGRTGKEDFIWGYDKWRDYGMNLNWKERIQGKYYNNFMIYASFILTLALNNDWDNLKKAPHWDWGSNIRNVDSNLQSGGQLAKMVYIICGTHITNHDYTYKKSKDLTKNQRRKLYYWLINHEYPSIENKEQQERDLQLAYYIFDKRRWEDYIQRVKYKKMNYYHETHWYGGKVDKKRKTLRIINIIQVINYLMDNYNYNKLYPYWPGNEKAVKEIDRILGEFMDGITMGKQETKKSRDLLKYSYNRSNHETEIYKIIMKYFPLNESISTSYNYFILKHNK